MENLVNFLKNDITEKMSLDDILNVFEKMCSFPINGDMILFETGTFSFTGDPLFLVSLVRQFPNEEEEYFQVHLDILYKPTSDNKVFKEATWNEDLSENIFDYIRSSKAFVYAKSQEYIGTEIYMDET